jgi:hypothetical protein
MKLIATAIFAGLALIALSIAVTNRLTVQPLPPESGWEWLVTNSWTGRVYVCRTPKIFGGDSCERLDYIDPSAE